MAMYREYAVNEVERIRSRIEKYPETNDINFAEVMRERVLDNRTKTVKYLGGWLSVPKYLSKNVELEMTEEEKKQMGLSDAAAKDSKAAKKTDKKDKKKKGKK